MSNSKEIYKKLLPNQFSDSRTVKKGKLDKDFLDYYLSTISSRSQEKDFEYFCKALLEVEICPNLLPQTGPTGGGDSKVDTETYPVAEQISETWLYGSGNKADTERWAFAISAKADWQAKLKSDVEKIAKTNIDGRNYTKIFFVSNQYISDKKRATQEDSLRKKYGVDIRVLSKDWLLEAVFRNDENKMIAVEKLGLSKDLVDEKLIGENDYRRLQELEEYEKILKETGEIKHSEIIYAAKRSLILFRELEKDEQETLACIDRYNRLATEYGTSIDKADALYESAWTIYWWYPSKDRFYNYYLKFEQIAIDEKTTYLFERLCTLWVNLFSITQQDENNNIDLAHHRITIESIYNYLISDNSKPNTILSARNSFQMIRIFRGDSVDDIVEDYIDIVSKSEKSLEIDAGIISKMIQEIPIYQEAKKYDQLFDLLVDRLSSEKRDKEAALMYANRGRQLVDTNPVRALSFLSKAVLSFHNEPNKDMLKQTVFLMAHLYEKMGLYWAARNYYFYVVTQCLLEYIKKGEISPVFAFAANSLKWVEFMQGRVIFSSEMHMIELIARNAYPGAIAEDENNFDALLPFLFFKTPFEKLCHLGKLSNYLDSRGLFLSSMACRYELGYYDEELLNAYSRCKEDVDDYMRQWANQPAWDQIRFDPWYGFEEQCVLESRIMGCTFRIQSTKDLFEIEFGITLLATIECFLGTGFYNEMVSRTSVFEIEVIKNSKDKLSIDIMYSLDNPTHMTVKISEYTNKEFQTAHELFSKKLTEIISTIISTMLNSEKEFQKLKEMIDSEYVLSRVNVFTDSLFYGFSTFGLEAFSFDKLLENFDEEPIVRDTKKVLYISERLPNSEYDDRNVIYERPPEFNLQQYKNDEVLMSDLINIPLWDVSGWCGVFYKIIPNTPPFLSLVFKNESGLKIFDEWIEKYGKDDVNNVIGIRIMKEIDSENLYWYRIGIGENSFCSTYKSHNKPVFISPVRMQTMQPQNGEYLKQFESAQSNIGDLIIYPSIFKEGDNKSLEEHFEKGILKHKESIKILYAYEIEKTDVLSVESLIPTDRPVIPPEMEDCVLKEILDKKRNVFDTDL